MTYRFAQSAFWGALALANIEALPWGEIKHFCLQNLRHWFKQAIFSANGVLTIGYYYRNLIMAEGYNAFGSPYWALKSFIFLSLPDDHPFWTSDEAVSQTPSHLVIPEARMILQRDETGQQVQLFTVGQHCELHAYAEAKYEKFVYSSVFGFSVAKGMIGLKQGAFDNTLAVSEGDGYYRSRYGVTSYKVEPDFLYSVWKPWHDVQIKTYVIPLMPWHVRLHFIETQRSLALADGGFAIQTEGESFILQSEESLAYYQAKTISGVVSLLGDQKSELIRPEPNTNLFHCKTGIPTLISQCVQGNFVMASAILGSVNQNKESLWTEKPQIKKLGHTYQIIFRKKRIEIML